MKSGSHKMIKMRNFCIILMMRAGQGNKSRMPNSRAKCVKLGRSDYTRMI